MSETPKPALDLAPWPEMDFSVFGEIETKKLSKIQQFVGRNLGRNWVMIPHVTHHEEADITDLDPARKALGEAAGTKITPLAYMVKAAVAALKAHPQFNASLDASGKNVIFKKYYNIGFAVDSPRGLLVPVIHNADKKSVVEIAQEITATSIKARDKGLTMDEMTGGCFTISSLGSFGGTYFTPIINAPEAATLGITKAFDKPTRAVDDSVAWRKMLPLSLSYDHRLINGADAAKFCNTFADAMANPTQLSSTDS